VVPRIYFSSSYRTTLTSNREASAISFPRGAKSLRVRSSHLEISFIAPLCGFSLFVLPSPGSGELGLPIVELGPIMTRFPRPVLSVLPASPHHYFVYFHEFPTGLYSNVTPTFLSPFTVVLALTHAVPHHTRCDRSAKALQFPLHYTFSSVFRDSTLTLDRPPGQRFSLTPALYSGCLSRLLHRTPTPDLNTDGEYRSSPLPPLLRRVDLLSTFVHIYFTLLFFPPPVMGPHSGALWTAHS